jgi:hypothetical protein
MEIKLDRTFYGVSLIWNILKRYLPELMTDAIRGMRAFKDM